MTDQQGEPKLHLARTHELGGHDLDAQVERQETGRSKRTLHFGGKNGMGD